MITTSDYRRNPSLHEGGEIMEDLIIEIQDEDEFLEPGEIASAYHLDPDYVYDVLYRRGL